VWLEARWHLGVEGARCLANEGALRPHLRLAAALTPLRVSAFVHAIACAIDLHGGDLVEDFSVEEPILAAVSVSPAARSRRAQAPSLSCDPGIA